MTTTASDEQAPYRTATERLSHWGDDEQGPPPPKAQWVRLAILAAALALLGMLGWGLLFMVLAIVVMITLHELGHYLTAKWGGMKVTEFFIFFGPRILSFRRGETEYGVKCIPAGAYVKVIGMHNLEEVPPEDEPRTYRQQSYPKRMAVALAGSTMHFILAFVLIWITLVAYGAPGGTIFGDRDDRIWEVAQVSRLASGESPAEQAGIQLGDKIVAIAGIEVETFEELRVEIRDRPGQTVDLVLLRDGERVETSTTLADSNPESGEEVGFLGIGPLAAIEDVGAFEAIPRTAGEFGAAARETVGFLGAFFSPSGIKDYADQVIGREPDVTGDPNAEPSAPVRPSGLIGVVRVAGEAAEFGFENLLVILIAINVFIGIFNLIPLLPFDGGHAAIATYERIRSRRGRRYFVDVTKLLPITYLVVFFLGMLFLTTTYLDIFRFPE